MDEFDEKLNSYMAEKIGDHSWLDDENVSFIPSDTKINKLDVMITFFKQEYAKASMCRSSVESLMKEEILCRVFSGICYLMFDVQNFYELIGKQTDLKEIYGDLMDQVISLFISVENPAISNWEDRVLGITIDDLLILLIQLNKKYSEHSAQNIKKKKEIPISRPFPSLPKLNESFCRSIL